MEEQLIRKIEAGIRALKLGTKAPKDTGVGSLFEKLKVINIGMHDDLIKRYQSAVNEYKAKNNL